MLFFKLSKELVNFSISKTEYHGVCNRTLYIHIVVKDAHLCTWGRLLVNSTSVRANIEVFHLELESIWGTRPFLLLEITATKLITTSTLLDSKFSGKPKIPGISTSKNRFMFGI